MSLQYILGRSGSGKTAAILDEMREKLRKDPQSSPIIYLVPEQMTFLSETKLAETKGLYGMIAAQVFSFTRLAWRVLQETGGMSRMHITSAGINMMITRIIEEKKGELRIFQRSASKPGFIKSMEEMLIELKRYCVSPENMRELLQNERGEDEQSLQDKLHDLELIYTEFEKVLFGKYLDSEDYLTLLAERIPESKYLQEAEIYIDGFYSLTPQELLVVNALLKTCKKVTVSLTLDQAFRQGPPMDFYLFNMSAKLYHTIYRLAVESHVPVEEDRHLKSQQRFRQPSLSHLESYFNRRPAIEYQGDTAATVMMAANRRAEMEGIAREIIKLVREDGLRWRDITILVRNGAAYHDLIQTIFADHQIPIFIDAKETMLHHPLIELIRSSLEAIHTNWRYEPVFRAIKTDLLYPLHADQQAMRLQVDRLENYVLSRGIKGDKWTNDQRWTYRRFRGLELDDKGQTDQERAIEDELNELRSLFSEPLSRLGGRCKRAKTGLEYCKALYLFLEEISVPEKLEALQMESEEKGDVTTAKHHDQAWKAVIGLLDEMVEMMGEMPLSLKEFVTILDSGLQAMHFAQIPPSIDHVLVANMDLSRVSDSKAAFVIGLNDGVLPMKATEEGILSDADRNNLHKSGIDLAPDSAARLMDEEFTAYKAFTTPSELLYISYPLGDEEGGSLMASPYIKRVKEVLPRAKQVFLQHEPNEEAEENLLRYMVNDDVALSHLTAVLQTKKRGYPVADIWYDLYNYYAASEERSAMLKKVLSSLFYENKAHKLSAETAKRLYGKCMTASVSRMEKYNACAFSHFASHGLKLQERKVYRLEAPDIGEMFHGALKIISDTLFQRKIEWAQLTRDECQRLANIAVEQLAPKLQNQILLSTNRHHYIKRKLENVISRASIVLSEQARHSGFAPISLELGFGMDGQLPPLTFTLANGTKMELIGRIDRIDKADYNGHVYVRIVDYKSSVKDINLDEVYYGLALQMLTYLDVIISHAAALVGTDAYPAGMLYFHVHNPIIKANEMMNRDRIEEEIFKQFKMKGLLLGDADILNLMDNNLEIGKSSKSDIISASLLKNGDISKTSKVASDQDFRLLRNHVHHMYQKAGNEIMDGETIINPYKLKDRIPCTYCPYRSVCLFDNALEENQYRLLPSKKPDEVLTIIQREEGAHE
ncbi:MAG: helicase-exonuclease AddAB subunit AddB [Bacillus sp. (in: firmicutes)]